MKPVMLCAVLALMTSAPQTNAVVASAEPANGAQWFAQGQAFYRAHRFRESVAAFERALQLHADSAASGARYIARAYARLGNERQASRWLTHACELERGGDEAGCHPPRDARVGGTSSPTRPGRAKIVRLL
ncbi:MAG: hypothetical protein ABJA80_12970 [bacterium]